MTYSAMGPKTIGSRSLETTALALLARRSATARVSQGSAHNLATGDSTETPSGRWHPVAAAWQRTVLIGSQSNNHSLAERSLSYADGDANTDYESS